jgi:polynucleotide 5'-kinase involved in rRNA processing
MIVKMGVVLSGGRRRSVRAQGATQRVNLPFHPRACWSPPTEFLFNLTNKMASVEESEQTKKPVACIVVGMAGSGKTTLMHRLHSHLYREDANDSYMINLDPAVLEVHPTFLLVVLTAMRFQRCRSASTSISATPSITKK